MSLADVEAEERAAEKAEEDALEAAAEEKLRRRRALQRTVVKVCGVKRERSVRARAGWLGNAIDKGR